VLPVPLLLVQLALLAPLAPLALQVQGLLLQEQELLLADSRLQPQPPHHQQRSQRFLESHALRSCLLRSLLHFLPFFSPLSRLPVISPDRQTLAFLLAG
jgi:hypothetical protein